MSRNAAGDHWLVQENAARKIFPLGVWAPRETIEDAQTDVKSRLPRNDAMLETAGRTRVFVAQGGKDWPIVLRQKIAEVQHSDQLVGIADFETMISDAPNTVDCVLHGSGAILLSGIAFSRRVQLSSSAAR